MSESLNINPPSLNELKKSKSANSLSCNLGPKVLVVEDNAVNRMILVTFLKKRGIRLDEAENGAIRPFTQKNRILQRRVSINSQNNSFSITSLLLKPKISIKYLNQQQNSKHHLFTIPSPIPSSPSFPIIENNTINTITKRSHSLTGLASEEDKDLAFESEVDGFLTKPVSLKMLEKVLKKWSEKKEQSSENSSVGSSNSSNSSSEGST
uniref:histidine kinase n=1 Tax=Rhizophagus irregularis (strain DAOM 181602 / DAOM 197198 / MUCL 43194) TaxID=747089 RepID=U9UCR2_RHIID